MRAVILLLVSLLLAGGALWLALMEDDAPQAGTPVRAQQTAPEHPSTPGSPQRGGRAPITGGTPTAGSTTPGRFTVPITLLAHDATSARRLDGFGFRVTNAIGDQTVAAQEETDSPHVLDLGVGSYTLHVSLTDFIAPAATSFSITRESQPVTLRLPFRPVEMLLRLEVLARNDNRRLDKYRVTVLVHTPGEREPRTRFLPQPRTNPLSIPAARGQRLVVKVEAEGYTPAEPVSVTFDDATRRVTRKVFLLPTMKFTGVELQVTDTGGVGVKRLEVLAQTRRQGGGRQFLWRRRHTNPNGTYRLPDLAPGAYRMEVSSIDANGLDTMHLPGAIEFEVTGGEHIVKQVTLQPGAGVELHLTDSRGNRIGTDVAIELIHPDGERRESRWRPLTDGRPDRAAPLTADHLIRATPARLDTILPPGRFRLKLRWRQGPVVTRTLDLVAGRLTRVEAQLSR